MRSHAVPSSGEPWVICPWWSLQRWLLSVSHGPFRAGYYLLIFVPRIQNDGLLFAAGISSNPSQAATCLGHHSTPLGPCRLLGALRGTLAPPPLLGNIAPSSLVLWIPLASLRYFILPSPPNLLSVTNILVVSNRKYSSNWHKNIYCFAFNNWTSRDGAGFRLGFVWSVKKNKIKRIEIYPYVPALFWALEGDTEVGKRSSVRVDLLWVQRPLSLSNSAQFVCLWAK